MTETVKKRGRNLPPGPGRPKGMVNKTTATLKEAILLAAEQVGENNNGKDGLTGYLRRVAMEDVKAFSTLLGKVLPLQLTGDPANPVGVIFQTVYEQPDH